MFVDRVLWYFAEVMYRLLWLMQCFRLPGYLVVGLEALRYLSRYLSWPQATYFCQTAERQKRYLNHRLLVTLNLD